LLIHPQVYQSIDYQHFLGLTVFAEQLRLEQLIVDMVRYSDMQITIDHRENCIRFGSGLTESSYDENLEEIQLQEMPSESVRLQLVNVFNCLEEAINLINPDRVSVCRFIEFSGQFQGFRFFSQFCLFPIR